MGGFRLVREPAVEGETYARAKGHKEVVDAEGRGDASGEEGKKKVKGEEGGSGNVLAVLDEAEKTIGEETNGDSNEEAKCALPKDGGEEPFPDRGARSGFHEDVKGDVEEREASAVIAARFSGETGGIASVWIETRMTCFLQMSQPPWYTV